VRSDILRERSESHGDKEAKAVAEAQKAGEAAGRYGEASDQQRTEAQKLHQEGLGQFTEGIAAQKNALGKQARTAQAFEGSVETEGELQGEARTGVDRLASAIQAGGSLLHQSQGSVSQLAGSVTGEKGSQAKIQSGINEFNNGLDASKASTEKGREAADMLKEARELELEGLRLQNRGQKMLLQARPKMTDAARLSAESFDAFKKADKQEEKAEELIAAGNEKLAAAGILREKAQAYESLAQSV
jgi:hypothetical protein